jgi:hypothetical protein
MTIRVMVMEFGRFIRLAPHYPVLWRRDTIIALAMPRRLGWLSHAFVAGDGEKERYCGPPHQTRDARAVEIYLTCFAREPRKFDVLPNQ